MGNQIFEGQDTQLRRDVSEHRIVLRLSYRK